MRQKFRHANGDGYVLLTHLYKELEAEIFLKN